jgi:O-antigen ligase
MAVFAGIATVRLMSTAGATGSGIYFVVMMLLTALGALVAPLDVVPAVIVIAYVLTPVKFTAIPGDPGALGPAIEGVAIWGLRLALNGEFTGLGGGGDRLGRLSLRLMTALTMWLLLESAVGAATRGVSGSRIYSAVWSLNFFLAVLLVAAGLWARPQAARRAMLVWEAAGVALSIYGVIEALVLSGNPLFGQLYASGTAPLTQVWSTYRITTTLGHPLVNGMFLSGASSIAIASVIAGRHKILHGAAAVVTLFGVALTASRGAIVAIVLATVAAMVIGRIRNAFQWRTFAIISAFIAVVATALVTGLGANLPVVQRAASTEAANSAQFRVPAFGQAWDLTSDRLVLGWGPGAADAVHSESAGSLENGWLEIFVDDGLPGLALFLGLVIVVLIRAWRQGSIEALSLVIAIAVGVGGFNFFDGEWPAMVMLGIALGSCLGTSAGAVSVAHNRSLSASPLLGSRYARLPAPEW